MKKEKTPEGEPNDARRVVGRLRERSSGAANDRGEVQGPDGAEDEVLTTSRRGLLGVRRPEGTALIGVQPEDVGAELAGLAPAVRTRVPPGRLPTAQPLALPEVLAGLLVAEAACVVLMIVLAFAAGWAELPALVGEHLLLTAAAGGLLVGGYVLSCRRSLRLARRKHLQGEVGRRRRTGEVPTRGGRRWL